MEFGWVRERDHQGGAQRERADVDQLSSRLRSIAPAAVFLILHGGPHNGVTDAWQPRWNAQVFMGLRQRLAQLPRLQRIRPGLHRLHQPEAVGASLRRHHPRREVARGAALGRCESHDRGRGASAATWPRSSWDASDLFKTLIAHAAVYNWYTVRGGLRGRQAALRRALGGARRLRDQLPHFGAKNFKTPTLVIHN